MYRKIGKSRVLINPKLYFKERVLIDKNNCWNWLGAISDTGYGRMTFLKNKKKVSYRPHRLTYEIFKGKIPEGLTIDHLCRNRKCVNPEHLRAVTARVNILSGKTVAAKNFMKTHCKSGHEFTKENTYLNRKEKRRSCRACNRKYCKKYYKKITRQNFN